MNPDDIRAIAAAMAETVRQAITGPRRLVCSAGWPSSPQPPCFAPATVAVAYDVAQGGAHDLTFTCRLALGQSESEVQYGALLEYLAPTGEASIKAALEAPGTPLAALVADVHVAAATVDGVAEWGGTAWYGSEITVQVML